MTKIITRFHKDYNEGTSGDISIVIKGSPKDVFTIVNELRVVMDKYPLWGELGGE